MRPMGRKLALSEDREAIRVERGPAFVFRFVTGHGFSHAATRPPIFREIKSAAQPRPNPTAQPA